MILDAKQHSELLPSITGSTGRGVPPLVFAFPKSRASSYEIAMGLCSVIETQSTSLVGNKKFNVVAFAEHQYGVALAALEALGGYKGLQVFCGATQLQWARTIHVLRCFTQSLSVTERGAYCTIKTTDGVMPCRLLVTSYLFKINHAMPFSNRHQIQAAAARQGCLFCPNLKEYRA